MLDDLGLSNAPSSGWSISRFATDYLSDDRASPDWMDVWMETYQICVDTDKPIVLPSSRPMFVESYAWDDTWAGETMIPDTCAVIADFAMDDGARGIMRVFGGGDESHADSGEQVAKLDQRVQDAVGVSGVRLTARVCGTRGQIHVSMPSDAQFFEEGARPAVAVRRFLEASGGTTHWRDRTAHR